MKKIIVCIALTLVCIMSATVSFLVNDISTYRAWMLDNRPQIMQNFGHKDKDKKMRPPQRENENPRKEDRRDDHGKDHHDMKRPAPQEATAPQPPAPAPAPAPQAESPAPAGENSSNN